MEIDEKRMRNTCFGFEPYQESYKRKIYIQIYCVFITIIHIYVLTTFSFFYTDSFMLHQYTLIRTTIL